jgi:hypothetical protein
MKGRLQQRRSELRNRTSGAFGSQRIDEAETPKAGASPWKQRISGDSAPKSLLHRAAEGPSFFFQEGHFFRRHEIF